MLLVTLAVAMLIPALADGLAGDADWQSFVKSFAVTLFVGGGLLVLNRSRQIQLNLRQAFAFTTISWLLIATFSALPFLFSTKLNMSVADSFFEAMSGITTTGSTVITELDTAPPGILLWRAMLQWLGGVGIIVTAVAILPMLRVGGMQLFRMESSDRSEKIVPRATQLASGIATLYITLTLICMVAYRLAGMSLFDALCHAMTTIATGGFSTHNLSFGHFHQFLSPAQATAIDWIAVTFMLLGAMPFVLYIQALRGQPSALFRDTQVGWFLSIVVIGVIALAAWQILELGSQASISIRYAAFNVVSIITGTGFATTDYNNWGGFAVATFFLLMFIGGCAGSTSCGIKVFRFQVLYATARTQVSRLMQPHGVFIPYYNRRPIPEDVTNSVMGFFFLFVVSFGVLVLLLSALGLDFVTAISGAATSIANVGPGLGQTIGPAGNFEPLPDAAMWIMSAGMLLGRLELFTVLILFAPSFWRS